MESIFSDPMRDRGWSGWDRGRFLISYSCRTGARLYDREGTVPCSVEYLFAIPIADPEQAFFNPRCFQRISLQYSYTGSYSGDSAKSDMPGVLLRNCHFKMSPETEGILAVLPANMFTF